MFYNDLKSKIRLGSFVDRVSIRGKVGEELSITLGNINLNQLLPHGVKFRGFRYTENPKDENGIPFPSPFYDPFTREIGIIVEKDPQLNGKVTSILKYSVLTILHEIGHAIEDIKRKTRLDRLENLGFLKSISSYYGKTENYYFRRAHLVSIYQGRNNEEPPFVKSEMKNNFLTQIDLEIARDKQGDSPYSIKNSLKARGRDIAEFRETIAEELTEKYFSTYSAANKLAQVGKIDEAMALIREQNNVVVKNYNEEYRTILTNETAKSERQAWSEGLKLARNLVKNKSIKVFDGSFEELVLFIDGLINAHGREAGRNGVKNPRSRKSLNIDDTVETGKTSGTGTTSFAMGFQ